MKQWLAGWTSLYVAMGLKPLGAYLCSAVQKSGDDADGVSHVTLVAERGQSPFGEQWCIKSFSGATVLTTPSRVLADSSRLS